MVQKIPLQVTQGMEVRSVDGKVLGNISGTCLHETETYLEVTPGAWLKVWKALDHPRCLYIPGEAVTNVSGERVTLSMDARVARGYKLRPQWFVGPNTANLKFW